MSRARLAGSRAIRPAQKRRHVPVTWPPASYILTVHFHHGRECAVECGGPSPLSGPADQVFGISTIIIGPPDRPYYGLMTAEIRSVRRPRIFYMSYAKYVDAAVSGRVLQWRVGSFPALQWWCVVWWCCKAAAVQLTFTRRKPQQTTNRWSAMCVQRTAVSHTGKLRELEIQ